LPALGTAMATAPPFLSTMTTTALSPHALLLKYDQAVPRYTSYPTAASFTTAVGEEQLRKQLAEPSDAPLSLYVHVPFCRHACWYCGCNRVTTQLGSTVVAPYLATLAQELELVSAALPARRRLAQLHWGGGTPNYLNATEQRQLWELIARHFDLEPHLEASIEVNPEFLSRDQALELRQLGFNRISFGIQDANPEVQQAVNRVVPAEQLRHAMGWLREAAFDSVNVDLICGLPLQTPERFDATLALVGDLQLTAHGYEAIGMDHYALAGDGLAVAAREGRLHRNFQGYTTGGELDLLGIGPTAISQFTHLFAQNQRDLRTWREAIEAGQLPVERGLEVRDAEVLVRRQLIQQVMCQFQVELDLERFAQEWDDLQALAVDGLVELKHLGGGQGQIRVTSEGRWLIRTIAAVFDPQQRQQARGSQLV
jgi:oxygen-independent coproporphyrinogen-3 oxidase